MITYLVHMRLELCKHLCRIRTEFGKSFHAVNMGKESDIGMRVAISRRTADSHTQLPYGRESSFQKGLAHALDIMRVIVTRHEG